MTQAEKAIKSFEKNNVIPNMGQRIMEGFGPGSVHVFQDGSIAMHWNDGEFTLGEIKE